MEAAAVEDEGPPWFQCPEDFAARRFAPGPPFSPETLQGAADNLLLIRAPADFPPESLNGHTVPLLGFRTVTTSRPDGREKTYKIQRCPEDLGSCTRLLVPSGHLDHLTCAPVFSGTLSIYEKYRDPSAPHPLFPVPHRQVPHFPEGLRQRFIPFGCQLKRSLPPGEAAKKAPRKRKRKKRRHRRAEENGDSEQQLPWEDRYPGLLSGESAGVSQEEQIRARHHPQPSNGAGEEAAGALPGPSASEQLLGQDPQASSKFGAFSERDLLSGETEDPARSSSSKKKKKKKKKETAAVGMGEWLDPHSEDQQAECELCLWGELEPAAGESAGLLRLGRHTKKRPQPSTAAGLEDPAALQGEAGRGLREMSCLGTLPEDNVASTQEDPGEQLSTGRQKKKKKRREEDEEKAAEEPLQEQDAEIQFLEPSSVTLDWRETPLGQEEPSVEAPDQKHKKKKKKKKHKGERAEAALD